MTGSERLAECIEDARLDADPRELDEDERVAALTATAKIVGLLRSTDMAMTSAREARPSNRRGGTAGRGIPCSGATPLTGWSDSILVDRKETAEETGATYRKRLRWLEASVGPEGRPNDERSSSGFRDNEELR